MSQGSTIHWVGGKGVGRRILVVDGDTTTRVALAEQLAGPLEARIDAVGTGAEALLLIENARFQMLVVGMMLPDMDGRALCRVLGERRFSAPIIMLSAGGSEADEILALDAGADDFIMMPCHPALLHARLRAHLRRFERSEDAVVQVGPYAFDFGHRWLIEDNTGRRIALSAKEAALLRYLYLGRGKPADVASIKRDVWGYRPSVQSHTAETHIYRLRLKIEPDPAHPRILIKGEGGYWLACASDRESAIGPSTLTEQNISHHGVRGSTIIHQPVASSSFPPPTHRRAKASSERVLSQAS